MGRKTAGPADAGRLGYRSGKMILESLSLVPRPEEGFFMITPNTDKPENAKFENRNNDRISKAQMTKTQEIVFHKKTALF
jgi:hypothetical protein